MRRARRLMRLGARVLSDRVRNQLPSWLWAAAISSILALGWGGGCSSHRATAPGDQQPPPRSRQAPATEEVVVTAFDLGATPAGVAESQLGDEQSLGDLKVVNDQAYHAMYFKHFGVNPTIDTDEESFSTFSVDVDNASYSLARSYLQRGFLPPEEAIRVEEFINSFDYGYRGPPDDVFDLAAEAAPSPTRPGYHVLHLGLKGKEVESTQRKVANLVFVIDVSGSMAIESRLGLVKKSLRMLVDQMTGEDSIGIVVYGSRARVVLEPVSAVHRDRILEVIDSLQAEGATNAQEGLELGYKMAHHNFRSGQINRVILCSDGVANVGAATGADSIYKRIEKEASRGITISTIGFGMGNYNDILMERLAQIGDGNYYYVDRENEARRVLVENLTATLQVIARDVKIQVEFDNSSVSRFRLLGYENRLLEREEFEDDRVDAGEIGSGHTVTALYEVKFRDRPGPIGMLRVRYKDPEGGPSQLIEKRIPSQIIREDLSSASSPMRLSFVVAAFAEKLRGSYWVRKLSYSDIEELYADLPDSTRSREEVAELRELIRSAARLDDRADKFQDDRPVPGLEFDQVPILE